MVRVDRESLVQARKRAPRALTIRVRGIVQGVGFRPFVFRLAREHGIRGSVANTSQGVVIHASGDGEELEGFVRALREQSPPLASISHIDIGPGPDEPVESFRILGSQPEGATTALIPPDVATCKACLEELFDPANRRYRYAFINCTDCGPRYSIIRNLPYDRPLTTMASFRLCRECRAEYEDPLDRRFHAEPNACPACGPGLVLADAGGHELEVDDPIEHAVRRVLQGEIVAVKGIGGFHLMVDATSERAVRRLRDRKRREEKPLAIMVATVERIRELCEVTTEEEELLRSPERPIVLLRRRPESERIAPAVAPGQQRLGVMLPYAPLHALLLDSELYAVVLTSGNLCEEPIASENEEALSRLAGIADVFLLHDRDIHRRVDDSVAMVAAGGVRLLRRARGYAPRPVTLKRELPPLLAVGGQLKNTVCLSRGTEAFLSPHIGDLDNLEAFESFRKTVRHLSKSLEIHPVAVAHDLHPDYLSTQWAVEESGLPTLGVQHHHAHVAAVMAEHGCEEPVVGVALDGTGYGTDRNVWGGEILVASLRGFYRAAHLSYVPLPGGDAAAREPWRMALVWLHRLFGYDLFSLHIPFIERLHPERSRLLLQALEAGVPWPMTSSCGRLFDAVAALCGLRERVSFEGQAAMELEGAADLHLLECTRNIEDLEEPAEGPALCSEVSVEGLIRLVVDELGRGEPVSAVSARFHARLARRLAFRVAEIAREAGLERVALAGGCFQNRILLTEMHRILTDSGLHVLLPTEAPPNDGGLALGQLAVLGARIAEEPDVC